jgi:preprotein translocase subunit Sec61beta
MTTIEMEPLEIKAGFDPFPAVAVAIAIALLFTLAKVQK